MKNVLRPQDWAEIRRIWEFSPAPLSYAEAAGRAGKKMGFTPPTRAACCRRAKSEGWERRGLTDVAASAAHLKADALVSSAVDGLIEKRPLSPEEDAALAGYSFEEFSDEAALVLARHRSEWGIIGQLVGEALAGREADPVTAFTRAKLAKIMCETLSIRQAGERKAWNLDWPSGANFDEMSDQELDAIIKGRRRR